jgi:RNA polymerase sigma-70 factor, ECF subfamily
LWYSYCKKTNAVDTNSQKISEFMNLYRPVQKRLSAYCRVVTGNHEKALDLIQETLATAFENFHALREPSSFQFFLIGIARNCHLKQQRRWKFFADRGHTKSSFVQYASDPVEMQYDLKLLHHSISRLNSNQREVVLLFHIMGFSLEEIADNLRLTEAAVKNRLVRGREKLRKLLSDKESRMINPVATNNLNSLTK